MHYEELLDIFDDSGHLIGCKPREAVHRDGDWHQVFNCLIVAGRSSGPAAILQLRGLGARAFSNMLDLTVGGHLRAGESPLDGVRELREELGLEVSADALVPLGMRRNVLPSGEGTPDREFINAFLLRDDRSVETYQICPAEGGGLFEVPIAALLAIFDSPGVTIPARGIVRGSGSAVMNAARQFVEADFVPNRPYWITLLVMAERFAFGRRPLAI